MPAHEETDQQQQPHQEKTRDPRDALKSHSPLGYERQDESMMESDEDSGDVGASIPDFRSLPDRAKHEKFIRDALEIILREAVFEVSSPCKTARERIDDCLIPRAPMRRYPLRTSVA
jgi:hypothetical protein